MPLVSDRITQHGANVGLLVAVSRARQAVLIKNGLSVPPPTCIQVQIDTGSAITGFRSAVFERLSIQPITTIPVRTTSTQPGSPHYASQFDVTISLVAGGAAQGFIPILAIAADDFDPDEEDGLEGILGRDILDRCNLEYHGPQKLFRLGW